MLALAPRRAALLLSCSVLIGGVAGCGSGGGANGGSSSNAAPASSTDGAALLSEATFLPKGKPLTSYTAGFSVSGTVDDPSGKDVKKLDGTASGSISVDGLDKAKGSTPPLKATFDVDGTYTTGSGKTGTAKYAGGATYVGQQLYVNWKGKDYAFGEELTKQVAAGFAQGLASKGPSADELQSVLTDPSKAAAGLDLDPATWISDPKVTDGGTLDGVDTYAVSGPVNVKAAATDLSEAFKKLPAMGKAPGAKQLDELGQIKDSDVAKVEKALRTRQLTVYIGKDDKVVRRVKLAVAGKDVDADMPGDFDVTLQLDTSKINQPQGIAAPKNPAPVTDLFAELQKDFPGIGNLLG